MSMNNHQQQQQHHQVPSSSSRMASSISRRSIFGRRSPDRRKKTCKNTKTEEKDRTLRALEAIRLLSFDTIECPITPRTVTTLSSDDATAEESNNNEPRTFFKKSPTTSYEKPKLLQALRPLPMTDRNSSGGTNRTIQRSESNTSYLSSDTSSEIGEWPSEVDDEQDYPRYICITTNNHNNTASRHGNVQQTQSNSSRLSITAVEEWNRRCEEEGGAFRREKYASDMLHNLKLDPSETLDQQQHHHPHHHGADACIDRRISCSALSPIESDDYLGDFSFDETEDDISLTYSHDE